MKADILIVAPHSDDAVLCLGGRMLKGKSGLESFSVLNLFSICAFTILPNLSDPLEITRLNNDEEKAALEKVGVIVEFMYFPEVLMRNYPDWRSLPAYRKDGQIKEKIIRRIVAEKKDRFYFPLGIGDHTDHQIVTTIAIELFKQGFFQNSELFFYEDLPYALEIGVGDKLEEVQQKLGVPLEERCLDISGVIDKKIDLICIYKTQYDRNYAMRIKRYAEELAEQKNKFYERSWKALTKT